MIWVEVIAEVGLPPLMYVVFYFLFCADSNIYLLQDWIQDISGDRKGKGRAHGPGPSNAKAAAAVETAKREEDLRSQYVIVPPGEEAHVMSCPICKETLKSEFLEDDEDWVWKNATKKDDKVNFPPLLHELPSVNILSVDIPCHMLRGSYRLDK